MYLCQDLTPSHQHLDQDEFLEIRRFTVDEAIEKIKRGEITDGKTITLIYAVKNMGL